MKENRKVKWRITSETDWRKYREKLEMVWDKVLLEGDNWYRKAIKLMKNVAFLTVGKTTEKNNKKERVDKRVEFATAEKNRAKMQLLRANSEQEIQQRKTELTEKKKALQVITTDVEAERTECEIKKTMQRYQNDKNVLWKIRKRINKTGKEKLYLIKNEHGTRIYDPEIAKETVASFYEKLYQPRKTDEEIKEWQTTIDQQMIFYEKDREYDKLNINREITLNEIKDGIKTLQKGKATGPDDIPNEFLIEGGRSVQLILWKVFNQIFTQLKRKCQRTGKKQKLSQYIKGKVILRS